MKRLVVVAIVVVLGVTPTFSVSAEPTPKVNSEANGHRADTYLDLDGQNTQPDSPPASSGAVSYPLVTRSISPNCRVEGTAGGVLCGVSCEEGQIEYVVITRRIESQGAPPKVTEDLECGLPDRSVQSLAIQEFYQTQVKVPAPTVHPANGLTLVNFPNVYSTDFTGYEHDTDIQTAKVRLKFTPVKYVWDFGDGKSLTSTQPGKPFDKKLTDRVQEMERVYPITHRYTDTGKFTSTVTIVINGQYSVNNGPWQPITGSLQATSPGLQLDIAQARGELITPKTS